MQLLLLKLSLQQTLFSMHSPTAETAAAEMLKLNTNFMIFQHVQKMCQSYDAVGDKRKKVR